MFDHFVGLVLKGLNLFSDCEIFKEHVEEIKEYIGKIENLASKSIFQ